MWTKHDLLVTLKLYIDIEIFCFSSQFGTDCKTLQKKKKNLFFFLVPYFYQISNLQDHNPQVTTDQSTRQYESQYI